MDMLAEMTRCRAARSAGWMRKLRPKFSANLAFTLIEVAIVLLLIGILVALAIPVFVSVRDLAERGVCWHNQRSIEYALMRWKADHPQEEFITSSCLREMGRFTWTSTAMCPGIPAVPSPSTSSKEAVPSIVPPTVRASGRFRGGAITLRTAPS